MTCTKYKFACLPSLHTFVRILRTAMQPPAETRLGPNQATKFNLFARIVKVFKDF